jgi:hypothetical protein
MYMASLALALSGLPHQEEFRPEAYAEKPDYEQSDIRIAEDGAASRLRPIQDGLDYWRVIIHEDRSSQDIDSCGSAPG